MTAAVEFRDVTVRYGATVALEGASFAVQPQRLTAIVGPNGAGKSTALDALMGFVAIDAGELLVHGESVDHRRADIVYVPQRGDIELDFPITVREVVEQGRFRTTGWFRRRTAADRSRVEEAMRLTEVHELARRQIGALSGGQRQRVFLARALAQDGDVVLLDEPFAGVDARTEAALLDVMRRMRDEGRTLLVVHHDLATVAANFDDVVLLRKRALASGPVREVMDREHLEALYGGALGLVAAAVRE